MTAFFAVARVTLRELLALRLTWVFAGAAALLLGLSLFLGNLSLDEQLRIYVHLGFFSISLVALALALTIAGTAVPREIERQTCQLSLARPIGRGAWLVGKWWGLATLVAVFVLVAGALHYIILGALFGASAVDAFRYAQALAAVLFESLVVLAAAFALSTRVRPTLAVLGGALIWCAGNWLPDLEFFARKSGAEYFQVAAVFLRSALPPLDHLQVRTAAFVTGEASAPESLPLFLLFCAGWVVVYLGLAIVAFRRRDLV